MKIRGYLRRACLWQLLEEGQLNMMQLATRIGTSTNVMCAAVVFLRKKGLVLADPVKVRVDGARSTVVYGLSREGVEHALHMQPKDATANGIPAELM